MALIKCEECGHMISDKAQKCPKCGCPVEHQPDTRNEQPIPPTIPIRQQEPEHIPQKEFEIDDIDEESDGGRKRIWIIVAAVVLLAAGIYILFFGGGKSDNDGIAETDSVETALDEVADNVEEVDYSIRPDGVGSFMIGETFYDYNTRDGKEIHYDDRDLSSDFVVVYDDAFEEEWYYAVMDMKAGGKTILKFYGGEQSTRPNINDCRIKAICVYSPTFHTENGIRVGMTVKDIITEYNATIELHEGEGGEEIDYITLSVPGCKGIIFYVDMKALGNGGNFNCVTVSDYDNLKRKVRESGRVKCISVGDYYFTQEKDKKDGTTAATDVGTHSSSSSQSVSEWIQGTWAYTEPRIGTSKVVITGTRIYVYFDGDLDYSGTYEIRGSELHYNIKKGQGSCYIDLDLSARWLKYDKGANSYMGKLVNGQYVYPNR